MTYMKNTIRLTQEEVETAEALGLSVEDYARNKALLLKEEAEYEAWLQTPAGVKYITAKEAKRQRELKRNREYLRAYRAKKRAMAQETLKDIETKDA